MSKTRDKETLLAELAELEKAEKVSKPILKKVKDVLSKPDKAVKSEEAYTQFPAKPLPIWISVSCATCGYKNTGRIPNYLMFINRETKVILCQKCYNKVV